MVGSIRSVGCRFGMTAELATEERSSRVEAPTENFILPVVRNVFVLVQISKKSSNRYQGKYIAKKGCEGSV